MRDLEYTCLFGGGAIRGAAHVGVIRALEQIGVRFQTLCGSSVGSIIAALYAVGYSVDELSEIFLSVNFELFRDISFGFSNKFALSKGDIFLDWLRELLEKKFYGDKYDRENSSHITFKDIKKNLVIITTNIKDFSCCEFSNFETPDFEIAMAVRISCCMPGLMRAINIDEKLLVDGDLMKGKPMWSLSKNLKNDNNRILEIRLEGTFSGTDKNPIEYVNGMYSCMTSSETDFVRDLYQKYDKYDYLVINTGDVVVVDFNYPEKKRNEIITSGYNQTISYFRDYLPKKKSNLLKTYNDIHNKLNSAKNLFLRKRYLNSKNAVSELFVIMANADNRIDESIYRDINNLQKLIYSNVRAGLLGSSSCGNRDTIEKLFKHITEEIDEKILGINEYLTQFPI